MIQKMISSYFALIFFLDSEDDLQILHEVPKVRSLQDVLNFNPGSSEALEES